MELLKAEFYDFLKAQGDKMLLASLIFVMLGILIHLEHHEAKSSMIPWLEKSADMLLGSLVTLITGQILRRSEEKK